MAPRCRDLRILRDERGWTSRSSAGSTAFSYLVVELGRRQRKTVAAGLACPTGHQYAKRTSSARFRLGTIRRGRQVADTQLARRRCLDAGRSGPSSCISLGAPNGGTSLARSMWQAEGWDPLAVLTFAGDHYRSEGTRPLLRNSQRLGTRWRAETVSPRRLGRACRRRVNKHARRTAPTGRRLKCEGFLVRVDYL